ncbi:hypothetical protein [Limisphaera sp. VF-2]|jgi:hypothetical protein|uniref:hypothetical protein n=1 Tax=Limisphaera sp. VF-2 TaxID=3400418 RepID=UPI001750FE20|nr:hypothetical protein [Limisphaera sp.]
MKLLFSEGRPDYSHYLFPYVVWAFPEPGETPADLLAAGFLPSSRQLDRFYLCRQIRVHLPSFRPSSENRRILRRGEAFEVTLLPRSQFDWTPERRDFCLAYARARFGPEVMTGARLDELMNSPMTTHIWQVRLRAGGAEVGLATLYLEPPRAAYYSYAFYDLGWRQLSLGMFMMTSAVEWLARQRFEFLYLGTCYSRNALYKTQFAGAEFFNGFRWSRNLDELKHLLARDSRPALESHLLESRDYRESFCPAPLSSLAAQHGFRAVPPHPQAPDRPDFSSSGTHH